MWRRMRGSLEGDGSRAAMNSSGRPLREEHLLPVSLKRRSARHVVISI